MDPTLSDSTFDPDRILNALNHHRVDYVLVGGVAARVHGAGRATADIDCVPATDEDNLQRLADALTDLGARLRVGGMSDEEARQLPLSLDAAKTSELPLITISTDKLILAAGTIGSTYLLLRNRSAFPHISPRLGTRFGGNGDLITFATRASTTKDGVRTPRTMDGSYGPVITSTIRVADQLDGAQGRGFYLQDAGYPDFVNWMLELFQAPSVFWQQRLFLTRLICSFVQGTGPVDSDLSGEISQLFGSTELSSGLLPLLGMGRDIPDGVMSLRQGLLDVNWTKKNSEPFFNRLLETMQQVAGVWDAKLIDNPTWYLGRTIAAHPLGGCPMGRNESEGVVDAWGEVFNYPGLIIADGSVLPGPVGANPSLTIAALANRFADRVIDKHQSIRGSVTRSNHL